MPFCAKCGKETQADWEACPFCSTKISGPINQPITVGTINDTPAVHEVPQNARSEQEPVALLLPEGNKTVNRTVVIVSIIIVVGIFVVPTLNEMVEDESKKRDCKGLMHEVEKEIHEDDVYAVGGLVGCQSYTWRVYYHNEWRHPIDIYWFHDSGCDDFMSGSSASYIGGLTLEGMDSEFATKGPHSLGYSDEFCMVVDNSDRGASEPPWNGVDDVAYVTIKIYGWNT